MMTNSKVELKLQEIFMKHTGIDFSRHEDLKSTNVFATQIGAGPRELILILFDIERELGIKVPQEYIVDGYFDCYSHIAETVMRQSQDMSTNTQ